MSQVLRASLLAALAVAAGRGLAHAGGEADPACLRIAGVVRDAQGRPLPAVSVEQERSPPPGHVRTSARTDVHGRFQVEGLAAGPVTLILTVQRSTIRKAVTTRTGVRDLVVVLDPGASLYVRIVDHVPGERSGSAWVTWEEDDGERHVRHTPVREDGWARFIALPPHRELEVWTVARADARHVRARGLRVGETERRIEAGEVKDIAGKVRGPVRRHQDLMITVDVYAHAPRGAFPGLRVARVRPEGDGSFRVRGLPPGTYLVDVGSRAGEILSVARPVEAGTTDALFVLE